MVHSDGVLSWMDVLSDMSGVLVCAWIASERMPSLGTDVIMVWACLLWVWAWLRIDRVLSEVTSLWRRHAGFVIGLTQKELVTMTWA